MRGRWGLLAHDKDFRFHPKSNGNALKGFKQGRLMKITL